MNLILLSGGSGKRLWPLSNDIRSKQFVKIFKRDDIYESMLQRVYNQIKSVDSSANIVIATSKSQVSAIHNQLGEQCKICVEPCRRDTFPAIALSVLYMIRNNLLRENDPVIICPVDPYVNIDYFEALKRLFSYTEKSSANLVLMGIEPTYPSEKYGYILPLNAANIISEVSSFKEKPETKIAEEYIRQGALWNAGVFAFKASYLLNKVTETIGYCDYELLYDNYEKLSAISFDYAVVEKEKSIDVIRYKGMWKDVGTWNELSEVMSENVFGEAVISDCNNVHVLNELDVPIIAIGLQDVIIGASAEGVIVSDKEKSVSIKNLIEDIDGQIRFAEKSWGSFKVIDVEDESLTMKVTIKAGDFMNYHSHERRDEVWTVISGRGRTIVDGMEQSVKTGDVITMQAGCRHTVIADTELKLIEVQLGKEISVSDKLKYDIED